MRKLDNKPDLIQFIKLANALCMTVAQSLVDNCWIGKIDGALSVPGIVQLCRLRLINLLGSSPPMVDPRD